MSASCLYRSCIITGPLWQAITSAKRQGPWASSLKYIFQSKWSTCLSRRFTGVKKVPNKIVFFISKDRSHYVDSKNHKKDGVTGFINCPVPFIWLGCSNACFSTENNRKIPRKILSTWCSHLSHSNKNFLTLKMHFTDVKDSKKYNFYICHGTN